MNYAAPVWLPGGNLQTIWPALYARRVNGPALRFRRERWTTPDSDFIDVDWLQDAPGNTLLVLFHGLEGSSASHYAQSFADFARTRGLAFAVPHFRGCSGELNLGPRAYHSAAGIQPARMRGTTTAHRREGLFISGVVQSKRPCRSGNYRSTDRVCRRAIHRNQRTP